MGRPSVHFLMILCILFLLLAQPVPTGNVAADGPEPFILRQLAREVQDIIVTPTEGAHVEFTSAAVLNLSYGASAEVFLEATTRGDCNITVTPNRFNRIYSGEVEVFVTVDVPAAAPGGFLFVQLDGVAFISNLDHSISAQVNTTRWIVPYFIIQCEYRFITENAGAIEIQFECWNHGNYFDSYKILIHNEADLKKDGVTIDPDNIPEIPMIGRGESERIFFFVKYSGDQFRYDGQLNVLVFSEVGERYGNHLVRTFIIPIHLGLGSTEQGKYIPRLSIVTVLLMLTAVLSYLTRTKPGKKTKKGT